MDIVILSKRVGARTLQRMQDAGYTIVDVTSKSDDTVHRKFSPFWPHGNITVDGHVSQSVEGIWQGLKVFENSGVDTGKFKITSMKNIKRSTRKHGKVLGHMYQGNITDYVSARRLIFVPAYNQLLSAMQEPLQELRKHEKLVLLDYETNEDIENTSKPLSHASLIKKALLAAP